METVGMSLFDPVVMETVPASPSFQENDRNSSTCLLNPSFWNYSGVHAEYSEGSGGSEAGAGDPLVCCQPGSERVIVIVLYAVVILTGCPGNALVIVAVLRNRDQFRNTTNLFVLNLSVADLLFLVFCVPFHVVIYTTSDWPFGESVCRLIHLVQYLSMVASIFTLVAMSVDRFMAVGYPIRTKHLRTPSVALAVSVGIWVASLAIASPWPVVYTVRTYDDLGPDPVEVCADDWGDLRGLRPFYFLALFVVAYAGPLAAISVLSVLMLRQLRHSLTQRSQLQRSLETKRRVTRLVIVIVMVFAVCWLPSHVVWLWVSFLGHTWQHTYAFYFLRITAHVLSYANSCVNPVIYALLSSQFREGVRRAFRCTRRHRPTLSPHRRPGPRGGGSRRRSSGMAIGEGGHFRRNQLRMRIVHRKPAATTSSMNCDETTC